VWFTTAAVAAWHAPASRERGGRPTYSAIAIAIETCLALRLVVHQPMRQTSSLIHSDVSIAPSLDIERNDIH
jgi:hypothetical protein